MERLFKDGLITTIIGILVLVIFGLKAIVYKAADKLFDTPKKSSGCKFKK